MALPRHWLIHTRRVLFHPQITIPSLLHGTGSIIDELSLHWKYCWNKSYCILASHTTTLDAIQCLLELYTCTRYISFPDTPRWKRPFSCSCWFWACALSGIPRRHSPPVAQNFAAKGVKDASTRDQPTANVSKYVNLRVLSAAAAEIIPYKENWYCMDVFTMCFDSRHLLRCWSCRNKSSY